MESDCGKQEEVEESPVEEEFDNDNHPSKCGPHRVWRV